jgi:hypothetical protein
LEPTVYQICVRDPLTERMAAALEGMTLHAGAFDTVFTGVVKDQSQLYGLLDRLLDLGSRAHQRAAADQGLDK